MSDSDSDISRSSLSQSASEQGFSSPGRQSATTGGIFGRLQAGHFGKDEAGSDDSIVEPAASSGDNIFGRRTITSESKPLESNPFASRVAQASSSGATKPTTSQVPSSSASLSGFRFTVPGASLSSSSTTNVKFPAASTAEVPSSSASPSSFRFTVPGASLSSSSTTNVKFPAVSAAEVPSSSASPSSFRFTVPGSSASSSSTTNVKFQAASVFGQSSFGKQENKTKTAASQKNVDVPQGSASGPSAISLFTFRYSILRDDTLTSCRMLGRNSDKSVH